MKVCKELSFIGKFELLLIMCLMLLKVGILNNTYCIWANKKLEMVDDKGIQEYTNGVFGEEISGFCIKNIKKCIYIIYFYCKKIKIKYTRICKY